jgi:hypothetical protein
MALWLMDDIYPSYEALDTDTNQDSVGAFAIDAYTNQPDLDGRQAEIGMDVLPLTQAVNESIGGQGVPLELIGWSNGIVPMEVSRGSFNGATIQPEQIDALYASQQYGDVGLSTRNETMVQGLRYQQNIFTVDETSASDSFVMPDFEDVPNG